MDEEEQRQKDRQDKLNLTSTSIQVWDPQPDESKASVWKDYYYTFKITTTVLILIMASMCVHDVCSHHKCTIMGWVLSLYLYVSSGTSTHVSRLAHQMPIPCQPELNILKQAKGLS